MATTNQLTGGGFQDITGNPLADGNLLLQLNQDATVNTVTAVVAGYQVEILLDSDGNVQTSPVQSVWPTDAMMPADSFYLVSAYSANGQLVWGPNAQQVLSTPSPFNVSAWVPGIVSL